ncbi:uncharacterized protein LOC119532393 [Choloepus didactylus]|uniref:uncharacterized protein LOC119532393 n=1 Tax=Choloepus didactylus TaxID=27675 RepID=UPI00189F0E4D|nr:uncharacterized protein LOC119532393 [Choloepus didactylus]
MEMIYSKGPPTNGKSGESANAVPHYHKLCSRVSHIWGNRRGQHIRSAMDKPRPGKTTFVIMVSPLPGKYELLAPPRPVHSPPPRSSQTVTSHARPPHPHFPNPLFSDLRSRKRHLGNIRILQARETWEPGLRGTSGLCALLTYIRHAPVAMSPALRSFFQPDAGALSVFCRRRGSLGDLPRTGRGGGRRQDLATAAAHRLRGPPRGR